MSIDLIRFSEGNDLGLTKIKNHYHMYIWTLDDRDRFYVVIVGLHLHSVTLLSTMNIYHALVTELVE